MFFWSRWYKNWSGFCQWMCMLSKKSSNILRKAIKIWPIFHLRFDNTNVLGSTSIWTCRISNFVLIFKLCLYEENNNKYSKFDMSKSLSYQGRKYGQIKSGRWAKILWPSKNIWTLSTCLVVIQITKDVTKRIITMMVKEVDVKVINHQYCNN